jgi:hypothetical protein
MMSPIKLIKSLLLAVLFFAAGSAVALNVTLSAKSDGSTTPTIAGKTNLPDGTELMFTLENKGINYRAQTKAFVSGGKFEAGPFSRNYSGLAKGTYTLEVSMSVARLQSKDVQNVIGGDGEKLAGAVVKKSGFGGNFVDYRTSIRVP